MISRIEQLDEDCDSLQSQLSDVVESKDDLETENERFRQRIVELEEKLEILRVRKLLKFFYLFLAIQNRKIWRFQLCIYYFLSQNSPSTAANKALYNIDNEIENLNRKISLLVCYPVIGEDYEAASNEYKNIINDRRFNSNDDNDDDVINEMEQQLKANTTRIGILEKQNSSLRNTLQKFDSRGFEEKQVSDFLLKSSAITFSI